ncbi:MAG: hypothetical protein KJ607_11170 [Bacteroidetes bacterium]|nr:hypothetical protein [Bacteroidota bacterium]
MKTTIFNLMTVLSLLALISINTGCEKTDEEEQIPVVTTQNNSPANPAQNAVTVAKEDATNDAVFSDVFRQVDDAARSSDESLESGNKSISTNGCAVVTITPFDLITWPKTITIDFGDVNCLCNDGVYRRGVITAVTTDWYRNDGCVITVTCDDYHVNDFKVEGTKIITNNGRNSDNNLNYTVEVQNGLVTAPDGTSSTWNSLRNHEWINGEDTYLIVTDDEYSITGGANGITSTNTSYTITITDTLNVLIGCPYIRSGMLDINIPNLETIVVDYGDGTCDAQATATCYGYTFPFTAGYCAEM